MTPVDPLLGFGLLLAAVLATAGAGLAGLLALSGLEKRLIPVPATARVANRTARVPNRR